MQAVEFQAKIKNGTIEIPSQYKDKLKEVVRVIILTDEGEITANLIDQLLASPVKVGDFKPLSRAEIYEWSSPLESPHLQATHSGGFLFAETKSLSFDM